MDLRIGDGKTSQPLQPQCCLEELLQFPATYDNSQDSDRYTILESLGGGVAMFDFDLDGKLDVCFAGGGRIGPGDQLTGIPPGLFRQSTAEDGRAIFLPVSSSALPELKVPYNHAVCAADYDNDGFDDFLVTGYGGLTLYHNMGDGTFEAVHARESGLDDTLWSSSAGWGDFNGDGDLDLFVVHYVDWTFQNDPFCPGPLEGQRETCPPANFQGLPDYLYLSKGDGQFVESSRQCGIAPNGRGLGVVIGDIDLDGDSDVYVANDAEVNFLYLNDGRGVFAESALTAGVAFGDGGNADGSMGVDFGDFNRDGRPDVWVANFESESFALYRNDSVSGHCLFQNVSRQTGVTSVGSLYVGWGTALLDLDRDGDEDIFVSNGHVARHPRNAPLRQRPLLLENDSGRQFRQHACPSAYLDSPHMGRGVAAGDIDDDGDLDLVVSHVNEPASLLANNSRNARHWLSVRLVGVRSARGGIGAVLRARTKHGEQLRLIKGGASYASTHDARCYWGLGDDDVVEELEVTWPSGAVQRLQGVAADQTLLVIEPVDSGADGA
ncbi:MAG: CRTAC1 family protein [Planctomycetales bacterium]|nr:CRTAC1 family protein [Planctomycetales bacterium]